MNAPCFPCAPGSTWTWRGTQVIIKTITVSGLYTPSPGLVSVVVETIGGGGGGGFCVQSPGTIGGGGGGGSGGYSRTALPAPIVAGGVNVVIGGGGTGLENPVTLVGGPGEPTNFGAFCAANGGMGGAGNTSSTTWGEPGAGALASIGDVAFGGNAGTPGTSQSVDAGVSLDVVGGMGGSIMGGAAASIFAPQGAGAAGNPGQGYGAGGGGAAVNQATLGYVGGDGSSGVCIVTEYCVSPGGSDCGCGPARVAAPICPPGWFGGFDG